MVADPPASRWSGAATSAAVGQQALTEERSGSELRIELIQPHRDHAFLDIVGDFDEEGVHDLRQRLDGLLTAGTRYVLADMSHTAGFASPVSAVLRAGAQHLQQHQGWLRILGHWPGMADHQASVGEVFALYQLVRPVHPGGSSPRRPRPLGPRHA